MKKKTFYGLLGLVIILAIAYLITAAAFGGVWNPFQWGKDNSAAEDIKDDTSNDNIAIASYALAADDFAAYGVSDNAISAGVLTAEYTPSNTTNKRTGWTWRFSSNEWSTGKNIADYVKFAAGTNYAPECTYEVLQPFGASIIVEATSRVNSELKATTSIEWVSRYDDFGANVYIGANEDNIDILSLLGSTNECDSTGTVRPDAVTGTLYFSFRSEVIQYAREFSEENVDLSGQFSFEINSSVFSINDVLAHFPDFGKRQLAECFVARSDGFNELCEFYGNFTAYYEGKEIYKFGIDGVSSIYFTEDWINKYSTLPTDVTLPDKVVL